MRRIICFLEWRKSLIFVGKVQIISQWILLEKHYWIIKKEITLKI